MGAVYENPINKEFMLIGMRERALLRNEAECYLVRAIYGREVDVVDLFKEQEGDKHPIAWWNDREDITKQDVLTVIDWAIKYAKEDELCALEASSS